MQQHASLSMSHTQRTGTYKLHLDGLRSRRSCSSASSQTTPATSCTSRTRYPTPSTPQPMRLSRVRLSERASHSLPSPSLLCS
jgi:hypothetical protein